MSETASPELPPLPGHSQLKPALDLFQQQQWDAMSDAILELLKQGVHETWSPDELKCAAEMLQKGYENTAYREDDMDVKPPFERMLHRIQGIATLWVKAGNTEAYASALSIMSMCLLELNDIGGAERAIYQARELASDALNAERQLDLAFIHGRVLRARGRFLEAEQVVEELLGAAARVGDVSWTHTALSEQCQLYIRMGRLAEAKEIAKRLQNSYQEQGNRESEATFCSRLSEAFSKAGLYSEAMEARLRQATLQQELGNMEDAFASLWTALSIARDVSEPGERRRLLGELEAKYRELDRLDEFTLNLQAKANEQFEQGKTADGMELARYALALRQEMGDCEGESGLWWLIIAIAEKAQDMGAALESCEQAAEHFRELGDIEREAVVLHRAAEFGLYAGENARGLNAGLRSLELLPALGEAGKAREPFVLYLVGQLLDEDRVAETISYYRRALPLFQAAGNSSYEAEVSANLACLLLGENVNEALDLFLRGLELGWPEDRGNSETCVMTKNMGYLASRQGLYKHAGFIWEKALALSLDLNETAQSVAILLHMSGLKVAVGDLASAEELYGEARLLAGETQDAEQRSEFTYILGRIRLRQSRFEEARDAFREALALWSAAGLDVEQGQALRALAYVALNCGEEAAEWLTRARLASEKGEDERGCQLCTLVETLSMDRAAAMPLVEEVQAYFENSPNREWYHRERSISAAWMAILHRPFEGWPESLAEKPFAMDEELLSLARNDPDRALRRLLRWAPS